jgi:ABC-type multidrug transport system ATPase subunit
LFNVLAGRVRSKGRVSVTADITLGGQPIHPAQDVNVRRALFAFVEQDDSLHIASTPRQALTFSARLRLPRSTSDAEIDQIVETFLDDLGLRACCDTVIGGGFLKGISGGEKRRTSIGVELVSRPALIFLDGTFYDGLAVDICYIAAVCFV